MATGKLSFATVLLLSLHVSHSYILLTANLDDVQAIAKQIASSPVANQFNQIIRRASSIFNQQFNKPDPKPELRSNPILDQHNSQAGGTGGTGGTDGADGTDGSDDEVWKPDPKDADTQKSRLSGSDISELSSENDSTVNQIQRRSNVGSTLGELEKNASFYLTSIKKIFDDI